MGACCWCEWAYIQEEPDSQALNITFLKKNSYDCRFLLEKRSGESGNYMKNNKKAGLLIRRDLL